MRIAVPQDPKTLNPVLSSNTIDGFVMRLMFEPLLSADERGTPVPMLAAHVPSMANGGVSRDGLRITYKLRPGVRWTDGTPVTSRDVKFTVSAIMNPSNNVVSRHGYDDIASIDTPDAATVIVHLKKPLASFVNTFFAESDQPYEIIPAHVLAKYSNLNQVPFNSAPTVSDGPFKFVRWAHGDRVVLAANDGFFLGKPKLRGIEVQTVANENTSVNLLRTGDIDYMFQASITTYPQLKDVRNVRLVWDTVNGYEGMQFNMRRAPMSDPRFRDAIAYAIDKNEMVRTLTYGQEKIATEDLPDWMWAANTSLQPHPYDPAKARALLAQMGLKTPLSLVLVTDTASVTHKREAVMLQAMLQRVGIDLEIKTYPGDLLYAPAGMGGILNGGKFDLALWPWYSGLDPDNSSQFTCANIPPNGYNESGYCNKQMESLQTAALSHYDQATRATAYHGIEALLARDNPILVFWWMRQQEALRANVSGFAPNPTVESWNAWQWELKT
jgi:peptide/nickel transport system substrate-binding protein